MGIMSLVLNGVNAWLNHSNKLNGRYALNKYNHSVLKTNTIILSSLVLCNQEQAQALSDSLYRQGIPPIKILEKKNSMFAFEDIQGKTGYFSLTDEFELKTLLYDERALVTEE